MTSCITCGKAVRKRDAHNVLAYEGESYLVCCPPCEQQFNGKPKYYVAAARSLFGQETDNATITTRPRQLGLRELQMLRGIKASFTEIERSYADINRHFDQISTSGGLEGLRNAMMDHRKMMDSLGQKLDVHAGSYFRSRIRLSLRPPGNRRALTADRKEKVKACITRSMH